LASHLPVRGTPVQFAPGECRSTAYEQRRPVGRFARRRGDRRVLGAFGAAWSSSPLVFSPGTLESESNW